MFPLVVFAFGVAVQLAVVTHVLFVCKREKEIVRVYVPAQNDETPRAAEAQPQPQAPATSAEQNQAPEQNQPASEKKAPVQAAPEKKPAPKPAPGQVNRAPQVVYVNRPYGYYRPYYGGYYGSYYGGLGCYDSYGCGYGYGGYGYGSCYSPCYTTSCCW